jgi:hypothetical protein
MIEGGTGEGDAVTGAVGDACTPVLPVSVNRNDWSRSMPFFLLF